MCKIIYFDFVGINMFETKYFPFKRSAFDSYSWELFLYKNDMHYAITVRIWVWKAISG